MLDAHQSFKRLWEVLGQLQLTRDARETLETDLKLLYELARENEDQSQEKKDG